ncbi:MAG: C10 family peptidase [Muribaculaceae bacterium]|nr:C10 family peptidase [Muribaculaceae bacterium]
MKKILSILTLVLVALHASAADVDLATARNAAKAFMSKQVANGRLRAAAVSNLTLLKAEASVAKPAAVDYYIFNGDKSYVVVAGDDEAPEILMYGEEGTVDLNNIPPAMQWLLNKYKFQIDGIKAGTRKAIAIPKTATAVAPLVTANWDQTKPYYNHTPTSGSTHAYTGCPATSLAMCFYMYKWPATYPALPAIPADNYNGYLAAPALEERAADWDNMIDEYTGPTNYDYTNAQAEAVSWLMRYVGQACNMGYSTSGSGANDPEILQACHTFGYTDAQLLTLTELVQSGWSYTNSSQKYTDAQWNEWMMAELQAGRPIEYMAYDITNGEVSGHAFNVFGCNSSGQYYVNWGWSGDSNGYCTLHNFTTATGATGQSGSYVFKYGEAMIIGIAPPASSNVPTITADPTSLDFGEIAAGTTTTKTFKVTGTNLEGDITVASSSANFTTSVTSVAQATAEGNGATITVTFKPTAGANATYNGTITLTSSNASSVEVSLTGKGKYEGPEIIVEPSTMTFENAAVGTSATQTLHVSGTNLSGIVMLTLTDANGVFKLSNSTISQNDALAGKDVTVTFTPKENVPYTATVKLASSNAETVTVTLTGNGAYPVPVMQPVDTTKVKYTSFRADWTDAAPTENVASYTLRVNYVSPEPPAPEYVLIGEADFSGLSAVTNSSGSYTNQANNASTYLPEGWTVNNYLYIDDGAIIVREQSNASSALRTSVNVPEGYDKVSVVVDCEAVQANSTDIETGLTVSTVNGGGTQTQMLTNDRGSYTYVFDASSSETLRFNPYTTSTRYWAYVGIYGIKIYAGDVNEDQGEAKLLASVETGDSTYRVIEGITDTFYVVNDLIGGGTYTYDVKAIYTNQSESEWSNLETVTLKQTPDEPAGLVGDVNLDGEVDVTDVNIVINIVLGRDQAENYDRRAYITDDDDIDVSDVNALINIILGKENN